MGSWSVNKHLKLRNIREQKFCIEKWKKINKDNIVLKLHPNFLKIAEHFIENSTSFNRAKAKYQQ